MKTPIVNGLTVMLGCLAAAIASGLTGFMPGVYIFGALAGLIIGGCIALGTPPWELY